MILLDLW